MNSRPGQYNPITLGAKVDLGVGGNIIDLYHEQLDPNATEGLVIAGSSTLKTEPECVAMLKAILQAGCCRIEERAEACRQVFTTCVTATSKQDFISRFVPDPDNPFVDAIHDAIRKEWQ